VGTVGSGGGTVRRLDGGRVRTGFIHLEREVVVGERDGDREREFYRRRRRYRYRYRSNKLKIDPDSDTDPDPEGSVGDREREYVGGENGDREREGVSGLHPIWRSSWRDETFGQIGRQPAEIRCWGQGKRKAEKREIREREGFRGGG
jgi:hypothetical protein